MKHFKLIDTGDRGWFIGNFPRAVFQTTMFEVCYNIGRKGEGIPHYHTNCEEIILIIFGSVKYENIIFSSGDIIVFEKNEVNSLQYLEDTAMIGVKIPAGGDDKVLI